MIYTLYLSSLVSLGNCHQHCADFDYFNGALCAPSEASEGADDAKEGDQKSRMDELAKTKEEAFS